MSEFDLFAATNTADPVDADPLKDFLAREQDQFAELGDDTNFGFSSESNNTLQSAENLGEKLEEDNFDPFGEKADVVAFEIPKEQVANVDNNIWETSDHNDDQYNALTRDGQPRLITDKILEWQQEQNKKLIIKDAESEKRNKEWIQLAKQELEDYHRHREEQLSKSNQINRQSEEAFIKERDEKKPGGEWERVCRLCDFNPKGTSRMTRDVSRMRSLLLQLKQTPNSTFAAA